MANRQQTNSYENSVDAFTQALATARKMQHDWLTYGVDFVNLYVEDANGDWLETWGHDEILGNQLLDAIKEFLVSDDDIAVRIRQHLKDQASEEKKPLTLFDLAVNLEECWRIPEVDDRLPVVRNILAGEDENVDTDNERLLDLANSLLAKLTEILN
ncbi:MAG: hypothetical protein AB3A66_19370 [Nodularia sp. CChRGM 3473]